MFRAGWLVVMLLILAPIVPCGADTITIDGVRHDHVLLRQSDALYYVQLPGTGTVLTVAKSKVAPDTVAFTTDAAERQALLDTWKENNAKRRGFTVAASSPATASPAPAPAANAGPETKPGTAPPRVLRLSGDASNQMNNGVSNGRLPYIKLNDVRMGDALKAILRGMGLDYRVQDDIIYISTPERLRTEAWETLETRVYQLNNAVDALPKVVLRNTLGTSAYNASGGGYGMQSGGYGGSYGAGMTGGTGYGNAAGGMGGYGGMSGYGGRAYGNADVTAITNISDLFSHIDDRIVGETPARLNE